MLRQNDSLEVLDIGANPRLDLRHVFPGLAQNRGLKVLKLGWLDHGFFVKHDV